MSIGYNIKRMRKAQGISQKRLAERACINQSTLSHIERGIGNASPSTVSAIARVLGCAVGELAEYADGSAWDTRCEQDRCDCAMYQRGSCLSLTDTHFRGACPFYKTREQAALEREQVRERLRALGMLELFGLKYGYPSSFCENKE